MIVGDERMNKREINKIIGKALQKHRLKCGYTQEQVSEYTGLASKYVSQIERGISSRNNRNIN